MKAFPRAETTDIVPWAQGLLLDGGVPFSFDGHEYLREPLADSHPNQVWSKAGQMGFTTVAMLQTLYDCLRLEDFRAAMYFFPTDQDVSDFSQGRFQPLLDENPELAASASDVHGRGADRVTLKRIGDAHLYFRGMRESKKGEKKLSAKLRSVPADRVTFDELDQMDPADVELARNRLGHSRYAIVLRIGNPTMPAFGIDEAYQESDRRHWLIRCDACRAFNCPDKDFPDKPGEDIRIIRRRKDGTHFLACRACAAPLDPSHGRWVAENPDRSKDCHGYRVSRLISRFCNLADVVERYTKRRFLPDLYNMTVGRAWASAEAKLDRNEVLKLCGADPMLDSSQARCTMGVDVGKDLHVVISRPHPTRPGIRQVVRLLVDVDRPTGAMRPFAGLDVLMTRFNIWRCVIDGGPYPHASRAFANRFPGKVFLSYFNEHQRGEIRWDEEQHMVTVNRTEILDASHETILNPRVVLPGQDPIVEMFADHLAADAKRLEEDPRTGSKRYVYVKFGENHFDFAYTYDFMAWMNEPQKPASRVLAVNRSRGPLADRG